MIISFLSINKDNTKTAFRSEGKRIRNCIQFEDKSSPGTQIQLTLLKNSVLLERVGKIKMVMLFSAEKETNGFYVDEDGLEFDYSIRTSSVSIEENKIKVSYALYQDHEEVSATTFQVTFFQK